MAATNRKVVVVVVFCVFFYFILLSYSLDMDFCVVVGGFYFNSNISNSSQPTSQPVSIRKRSNSTTLYRLDGDDFVLVDTLLDYGQTQK
jgi:hypothetical protein